MVCGTGAGKRLRLRQLHSGIHRLQHESWQKRFEEKRLPLIGDDIKSQVGATIVHRVLTNLFRERGVRLDRTYQLNFGGNSDFENMLERERLESKKISKTRAVTSQLDIPLSAANPCRAQRLRALADGPQMVPTSAWKAPLLAMFRLTRTEARSVGFAQFGRCGDRCGAVREAGAGSGHRRGFDRSSQLFHESPPQQFTDEEARERTLRFINGD